MDAKSIKALKDAISKPTKVSVLGIEIELVAPTLDRSIEVRQLMFTSAEDTERSPETFIRTTVKAVQACLPEGAFTEEEIEALVLRSGGENGELGAAAMDLLGLGSFVPKVAKEAVPFS